MKERRRIPIHAVDATAFVAQTTTHLAHGNVVPVLHEIRHALARLIERGVPTTIDLRAIPMGPGEEAAIEEALGVGEVEIQVRALGTSTVVETAHAGVWLVTHRDEGGQIVARLVEITYLPEIAASQPEDVAVGLRTLSERLGLATQPLRSRRVSADSPHHPKGNA